MYFDEAGKVNTRQTLTAAFERARALGLNEAVIASTTGETALAAVEIFDKFVITAVTYHCGWREPFQPAMPETARKTLEKAGVRVISASHALSGIERSVAAKQGGGGNPVLLIADTLRLFGQGTKVAVEVTVMAADGGALSGADMVAVGGSSRGADTALILKPAHQNNFFDLRIREIVCKPRHF